MAIEIVDFPMKNGGSFHSKLLVITRGISSIDQEIIPHNEVIVVFNEMASAKSTGNLTVCYGKSPFLMGKFTISMAIFNSYVSLPEGKSTGPQGQYDTTAPEVNNA